MDQKKPIGIVSGRLFCLLLAAFFLSALPPYWLRELWFDEVLTLQFAFLPSASEIYRSYFIPNNQIIHTVFLHALLGVFPPEYLRFFPLICAGAMIWVLWKNFARPVGKPQLAVALTALITAPPFLLYATALRGYMLSSLFTVLALIAGKNYLLRRRKIFLLYWFLLVILTVGVMPSALAGIAGAGLYLIPYAGKKFWKNWKLYHLAVAVPVGFLIFYGPIKTELSAAFALKEGWHHAGYALLAVAVTLLLTFPVPLAAGVFYHHPAWRNWPRMLIWLLPLGGAILPVSPFPRVWFVLFPLLALVTAGYLRKVPEKVLRYLLFGALLWGAVMQNGPLREQLSPAVSLAGQDDFYAPRFIRKEFTPGRTLTVIKENFPMEKMIFVSFDADPWSLLYYDGRVKFDGPRGKVGILADGCAVVLTREEAPEKYSSRFGGYLEKVADSGIHTVYRFYEEKRP